MNETIKARWIAELRSGKYKQGRGYLRRTNDETDEDELCCLGVLCELAVEDGIVFKTFVPEHDVYRFHIEEDESDTVLPRAVMAWAGLDPKIGYEVRTNPDPHDVADPQYLTTYNDDLAYNFNQIADVIEAKL